MRIKIVGIIDRGVPDKERLHLSVLADVDIVNYVIFDTVKIANGTKILAIPKRAFWFSSVQVRAGDNVVVYTRGGTPSKSIRPDGGHNHFFFWGQSSTLWHIPNSCAVVLEINEWVTSL